MIQSSCQRILVVPGNLLRFCSLQVCLIITMTSQPPDRLAHLTLTPKHSTRPGFITRVGGGVGGSREKPNSREKKATLPAPDSTETSNSDPETDLDTENVAGRATSLILKDTQILT